MPTFTNSVIGNDNAVVGAAVDGRGVEGWSSSQYGVAGESKKSAGVRGTSAQGRGVEGWSDGNWGVGGFSKTSIGVHGQSDGADGIYGTSKTGVAVHGYGGKLAGLFEGGVQIFGGFVADGMNVVNVVQQLSQQVAILSARLNALAPAAPGPNPGATATKGVISVAVQPDSGQNSYKARISGYGFQPNENVNILSSTSGGAYSPWGAAGANAQGNIDMTFTVLGNPAPQTKTTYNILAVGQLSGRSADTSFAV
jgi:hypothetical protein